jgi:hypothetical protein
MKIRGFVVLGHLLVMPGCEGKSGVIVQKRNSLRSQIRRVGGNIYATYRKCKRSPQSTQTIFCVEIGNYINRQRHLLRNYMAVGERFKRSK